MGQKITIKVRDNKKEVNIQIREHMTINNLKAVIEGALQQKLDWECIMMNDEELAGHGKLCDLGIIDGTVMEFH